MTVDCVKNSSVHVQLMYVVAGATWEPEYDLYFSGSDEERAVTLNTSAIIRQSTGEDWQ